MEVTSVSAAGVSDLMEDGRYDKVLWFDVGADRSFDI
jgi:hypothetical protein